MRLYRTTVAVLAVGILFIAVGGYVYHGLIVECNGCRNLSSANDLHVENERVEAVTVDVTVVQNNSTVANATTTVGPTNETELTDLVPYGEYALAISVGNESLRTDWPARSCYHQTIVVEDDGLDELLGVC